MNKEKQEKLMCSSYNLVPSEEADLILASAREIENGVEQIT